MTSIVGFHHGNEFTNGDLMTDDAYEGATAGRVLEFGSNETVNFPAAFKDAMGTDRGLMVLVHKDRLIKIFPLDSDEVLFLSLEIGKLSNDFLTKLSQIFKRAGLVDLLFSTGVCLRGTRCFYECYFNPTQLSSDLGDLETQLNVLDGVQRILVEKVNI
ncbi:MAG: hypothetical protein RTV31_08490 [Candidatus Thorarchaeota archaeon]